MRLNFIIAALFLNCSISLAQSFPTDTLVFNGPGENRVNLVFLGDGYLAGDMGKYLVDVRRVVDKLSDTSPFKEYIGHFNVIAIKVPSNERGAARDPDALIDNYFGSTYNFAGIERLLVPTKNDVVASVLADNFPAYDQAFVIVNDSKYGGSGGWLATASTNLSSIDVPIHEIGHSLANLADEYWAGEQFARERPNLTAEPNPEIIRWKNWLGEPGVGIYEHTGGPNWYKPYQGCKMQQNGTPFCPVCKERFIEVFQELTRNYDDYSPKNQSGLADPEEFQVDMVEPTPNTLKTWWLLNGDTLAKNSNMMSLALSEISAGQNELTMTVVDTTAFSRKEQIRAQSVTWLFDASSNPIQMTSSDNDIIIDRSALEPDIITSVDDPFIQEIGFKAFPNPTSNLLTVTFRNTATVNFNLQLVGMDGQTHQNVPDRILPPGDQIFEINTSQLKKGIYLVQMVIGDRLVVHKILK